MPYLLEGITPRTDPYYVMAIFDDDASGFPSGPQGGDLISTDGTGIASIMIDSEGSWELDLELNLLFGSTGP